MSEQSSDLDALGSAIGREVEAIVQNIRKGDVPLDPIPLDDDNEDEDEWGEDEDAYDRAIEQIEAIDLTQDDGEAEAKDELSGAGVTAADLRCDHYRKGLRNPCLCNRFEDTEQYNGNGRCLRKGQVFALVKELRVARYPIDFVEITCIYKHRANAPVLVRGIPYTRTRNMDGRLAPYKNEVCRIIEIEMDDPRPSSEQSVIEVTLDMIHSIPRDLHKTNKPFPECRFDPEAYPTKEKRETLAPLTCRWEQKMLYPDRRYRRHQRPVDGEFLKHLTENDVPKKRHRTSDAARLAQWRGVETRRGGSYVPTLDRDTSLEGIQKRQDGYRVRVEGQRYTVADMFSGAGGFTTGAKRAGFRVETAVDYWARANATYRANHPEVDLHGTDVAKFCNDLTAPRGPVDVVHLSPPCQTWSPAHTCAGRNDRANVQALFACAHVVSALRPRLVTLEQTFGLAQERHLAFFNALARSLAGLGYSLAWKVVRLVDFGLPQARKRLVLVGSAPGEPPLPEPWPRPTHGDDGEGGEQHAHHQLRLPRRRPLVSAIRACRGLVEGEGLHDVAGAKPMDSPPWDGGRPMNRTITTSGGQAYHWGGRRGLTLAEFMRLQGFPRGYRFVGPCVKKQIGNAFPPVVVGRIMAHLRGWLERTDRVRPEPCEPVSSDSEDDGDSGGGGGGEDRRRSSGGSSVVVLGSRALTTVIEDDDEEEKPHLLRQKGCDQLTDQAGPTSWRAEETQPVHMIEQDAEQAAAERSMQDVAPLEGQQEEEGQDAGEASSPGARAAGSTASGSAHAGSGSVPSYPASSFQRHGMGYDAAVLLAREASRHEAVARMERVSLGAGEGPAAGPPGAGHFGGLDGFGPAHAHGDGGKDEEGQEENEGEGEAVSKRPFDGGGGDIEGSQAKRPRTGSA